MDIFYLELVLEKPQNIFYVLKSSFSSSCIYKLLYITLQVFLSMERSVANEASKATIMAEDYKKDLEFIEEVTSNVDDVQRRVLAEIISQNVHVEYLQRHNLNGSTDRDTFKKVVPVITYEDIQLDIKRIAYGDKSPILCSQPISELLSSSGTSGGESKLIPSTEAALGRRLQLLKLLMSVMSQVAPDFGKGKGMYFMFISSEQKTPGGLLARFFTTSFYKSPYINCGYPCRKFTSPTATILSQDSYQSMYSQMLCGLCQNQEVLRVGSLFATGFIRGIRFLEKHWSLLCNDIRNGTINTQITDPSVREAVMEILKPDPKLADFIEAECSKDSWQGIITRLWPNTKYVDAILTGSMSQYIPILDYYSNSLPLISTLYGSSECHFGINLNPFCKPSEVSYTLIPTMCYFEFLPYHGNSGVTDSISMPKSLNEKEQQQLVDLADVEIGQEYELVVTTYSGLYRYRVGDVLRVAGYKNNAPRFNFLCRENVILSIGADFTNEVELQNAVKNAVGNLMPFDSQVTEYTSYVDITTIPSHYVLFWELSANDSTPVPPSVFEDCCLTIEESLNYFYREGRASNESIGPLEIRVVENETFDKLMDYCSSLGASMNQYKTPRCVKYAPLIEMLNSRVVSNYFSPTCPKWVPGYKKWNNTN
ncbi:indole-3-acetic acid-amido synthetase GH3.6-like [Nicotiana tabacum]|uniref:indole-3-acetic acid-amido synthetase GH3.6-like n=1 Tax=Nicotiana tabacum TaxID=4097 RepID=UPI003F4E9341